MAGLTANELAAIEEQLSIEQNMVKKYKMYSLACQDLQLKKKCEEFSASHFSHYEKLLNLLNG